MQQKHRYIPGLDGLRAFAVLSVMAYHFSFSWAKGGFLGVDIFFVLSGYLITSIAIPAQGNSIELNVREFWLKRIRRLLPAAYVLIITTFVWVMLFQREMLHSLRGDAISSIFYSSNWWFIFHNLSYFDSFGAPSILKNLWSLAIEEQFYIIWPIVLIAGFRFFKKRSSLLMIVLSGIIISALLMGILYQPGADPSRVYYGTDTRSFELLIGCLLAFVWPMKKLSSKNLSTKLGNLLNITSFIAFGILILSVGFIDEYQSFLYRGGMVLICINAAILIACISHPASVLGKLLSFKPLYWIGSRSYGIYLWHYPIMVLSTPIQEIGNPVYWRVGLQVVITFLVAELSYRFIEMPIRKKGFRPYFRQYLLINRLNWRGFPFAKKMTTILLPLVILVFTVGMAGVVKGKEQLRTTAAYPMQVQIIGKEYFPREMEPVVPNNSKTTEGKPPHQANGDALPPIDEQNKEAAKPVETNTNDTAENKAYTRILAIGDSIMLDIASDLHEKYPEMTIDGEVGRQVSQAVELAPSYANYNQSGNAVIIELGTNGFFTNKQLDSLLQSFSNTHIYLVNTRVPRQWEGKVNNALEAKAKENDHITLIDWHSAAINHPEYFTNDGVHLQLKGIEALTSLIEQAINVP
ncbi:acetyltransferase [Caldibacillus lycopersici]|uniref:Acetyltransferase n=1 Tax=Perspicuibacillus lycopersici TaxID=1325689 RepID=A0AAE3LMR2_9BACI|nr:acyltransferase family protein [Perspicuibacillus lycopersici]MCU9613032.1 acetyltransferase [Perspicuibacillus lycopersici]